MACTLATPNIHAAEIRADATDSVFSIDTFLDRERAKDLLRFSTAGSVDDGKSTLIGRLLYDTQSVYDDQVRAIQAKGTTGQHQLDFALLTDGLRAEREQGITIDVAYRYFSTAKRKFIIADTPGHEQYTRNMATGASTADAAIVLVDARKGVLVQSRRHAYIAALLGVRQIIVAINKMDLIGYDEAVFLSIREAFTEFMHGVAAQVGTAPQLHFIPVSALLGVNVVHRSNVHERASVHERNETPWYEGASLLELLEALPTSVHDEAAPFRFPVQRVSRPNQQFRGFAGQIASGSIRVGDGIMALPSRRTSRVERIVTYDGDLSVANAPLSVTLTLEDELDIGRGDLLIRSSDTATESSRFEASLVWMDARPLEPSRRYLLKHATQSVPAQVCLRELVRLDATTSANATTIEMNGIGVAAIETRRPIALERYSENRTMGAFVLIDPETNATAAVGMVRSVLAAEGDATGTSAVTAEERARLWGHSGATLRLAGPVALANMLERTLLRDGAFVLRSDSDHATDAKLAAAGALVLVSSESEAGEIMLQIDASTAERIPAAQLEQCVADMLDQMRRAKILLREVAQ